MGNARSCDENSNKRKIAYRKYKHALREGKLVPLKACENCMGDEIIQGHHVDYDRPLDVIWLCRACHMKAHYKMDQFTCENEFKKRTSNDLNYEKKEVLYKKLGLNKYRRIPFNERCTKEELIQLEEYKKLWNQFMIEHFRAKDNANFYLEKMRVFEMELREKYPEEVEQLY